ncbi:MAG: hypothetical protein IMF09_02900 [Proteobacteria bacterium]|nr:hypothetical protein [Pseudomonadota bacterium]
MELLTEVFRAALTVGLPICVFTLAMVWWALHRGHFQETGDFKGLELEIKSMSKNGKKNSSKAKVPVSIKSSDIIHDKWIKFGGGFYGIAALFTWLVIEVTDIVEMIMNFGGFFKFLQNLNIGLIVHILIEGLTNFIAAIIWPVYWLKRIDTTQTWLWFIAAYAGYWLGVKFAMQLKSRLNNS